MANNAIYMINALWFKPEGGRERYGEYLAATRDIIRELEIGAKIHDQYVPEAVVIGDWDPDLVLVVEYPSREAFDRLVTSEQFAKIKGIREGAILKSQLLRCTRP